MVLAWRPAKARHKKLRSGQKPEHVRHSEKPARPAPTGPATAPIGCSVAFPRSHWLPLALAQPPFSGALCCLGGGEAGEAPSLGPAGAQGEVWLPQK